jgi:uncharacterized membrane protein SpoIIM required for sporulation
VEFLSDGSIRGILILAGIVMGLFGVYLYIVYLSNQAIRRMGRRSRDGAKEPPPPGVFTKARWAIPILIAVAGSLFGLLVCMTGIGK